MINSTTTCLLCGGNSELKLEGYPGYQEPMTFEIFHCKSCNTSFSLPRLVDTKEIYDSIYANGINVPSYSRYWIYAESVKKKTKPFDYLARSEHVYWGVRESLSKVIKNKHDSKILEVGSGLGYLTFSLNKAGYNATGIDISEKAVDQARENYGNLYVCADIYKYANEKANSYDLVILTELIEHVEDPLGFMEVVMNLLKPGGKVILTTPNKTIFPNEIIWLTELPPVHCWWFSEQSVKYIAKRLNAKVSFVDFTNYYKKKVFQYNIHKLKNRPFPLAILDENGKVVVNKKRKTKPRVISMIRIILFKVPFVTDVYKKLQGLFNPGLITCKEKGIVLCGVIEKL